MKTIDLKQLDRELRAFKDRMHQATDLFIHIDRFFNISKKTIDNIEKQYESYYKITDSIDVIIAMIECDFKYVDLQMFLPSVLNKLLLDIIELPAYKNRALGVGDFPILFHKNSETMET